MNIKRPDSLTSLTDDQTLYWVFYNLFSNVSVWLLVLITLLASILPDITLKYLEKYLNRNQNASYNKRGSYFSAESFEKANQIQFGQSQIQKVIR